TPYIIVARDGGFVTCLGKGMSVGDHVVVPRERMDALIAEREDVRNATARVRDTGNARRLYHRLYRGGSSLSREDIRTLRALYPLYWRDLFESTLDLAGALEEFRGRYRGGYYRRKTAAALEELELYWQSSWALGHLIALLGTVLRELFERSILSVESMDGMGLAFLTARNPSTPLVLRGAWAASRAGHHLLASYKQTFETASDYLLLADSMVALTSIGLRHRRLRGEVRKILARRRNPVLAPGVRHGDGKLAQVILPEYEGVLDAQEDVARLAHRVLGAGVYLRTCGGPPPEDPEYSKKVMEVPEEIAFGMFALIDTHLIRESEAKVLLPIQLPWLARADLDDLYLPAEVLATMDLSFHPDPVLAQLDDHAWYTYRSVPLRRKAVPGRNEPCSCGSGKKYKRCCGAAA
ncbi:MAG TPA: SEC-C metal-binding domain-containing protein, partial [Haliangium sp.]|nr:SEC-C metal-binding domain-containing protein [Haliangium sp.]